MFDRFNVRLISWGQICYRCTTGGCIRGNDKFIGIKGRRNYVGSS